MPSLKVLVAIVLAAAPAAPAPVLADGMAHQFERAAARVRDAGFNRVAPLGAAMTRQAAGATASATGNLVAVTQQGVGNTLLLEVRQSNTGAVAAGTALNGGLRLD